LIGKSLLTRRVSRIRDGKIRLPNLLDTPRVSQFSWRRAGPWGAGTRR
jgi:hypothetical protein